MVDSKVKPSAALGVLTWIDALERIDTLLLEMRHFQCNIIFSLRLPVLYQALAFEESYLWGEFSNEEFRKEAPPVRGQEDGSSGSSSRRNSWFEVFDKIRDSGSDIRALANAWIIRFPPGSGISECMEFAREFTNTEVRRTIEENINMLVEHINSTGAWSLDMRRHYHNLCALQAMKSNILRDKLVLCRSGYRTFQRVMTKSHDSNDFIDRLGEFMIMRSAVIMRLNTYVERFGDLQAQFQNFLDLSLQEDPPPMVRRRQEQGVYTSFLSMRCREVQEAIGDLLSFLRPNDEPPRGTPLVMHRWRHDFTSSTQRLYDDTSEPQQAPSDIQFINSSYWMPDRPDLLSGLAHELAHQDIYTRYHNFSSPLLDAERDPLARLVKLLNHCFESFGLFPDDASQTPGNRPDFTLPEIGSDLIAAGVEGHAYLYALFLELTTCELGDILEVPIERWDLDLRVGIDGSVNPESIGRAWYFRLKILCAWLEAIHHRESGPIVILLITGIRDIVDAVQRHLAKNTPHQKPNAFFYWENLTVRLCTLVQRSTAARAVRAWRDARSRIVPPGTNRLRSTPRFYDPLDVDLRNFLLRMFLDMKCAKGRLLHHLRDALLDDLIEPFEQAYFGGAKLDQQSYPRDAFILHEDSLRFRHIYDLPWESAILSAIDFVHDDSTAAKEGWLYLFHYQTGMGRELYKVALEFYIQHSRKTSDRLATAIRVVMEFLQNSSSPDVSSLAQWLWGENRSPALLRNDPYSLWEEIIMAIEELGNRQHGPGLSITSEGLLDNGRACANKTPAVAFKETHFVGFALHRASYPAIEQWVQRIIAGSQGFASEQAQAAATTHLRKVLGFRRNQKKMAEQIIEKNTGIQDRYVTWNFDGGF